MAREYVDYKAKTVNDVLFVTIPWPSASVMKALTPHTTGRGFRGKAKATKSQRWSVGLCVKDVWRGRAPLEHAKIEFTFYKPSGHHIDYLNMAQRVKGAIDGIVDGGFIPGDDDRFLSVGGEWGCVIDRNRPRIELFLFPMTPPIIHEEQ